MAMQPGSEISDEILQEQQVYYRERAAEYDQWWERVGRYDRGEAENAVWFAEQDEVRAAFMGADWSGDVLELAGGTGIWTEFLARHARHVTVLDGAPEMIAINQQRIRDHGWAEHVAYQQVDLFEWQPEREYDAVFMGYFLSHVPAERLDAFLAKIATALRSGGALGILDGRREERSSSPDQPPPPEEEHVMTRRLNDGRTFQIVKRYDEPDTLSAALARQRITANTHTTATHYLYCIGTKR